MRQKIQRFMQGRYGMDQLGRGIVLLAAVFLLIYSFAHLTVFWGLAIAALVICYARALSRNVQKRYQENVKYLQIKNKTVYKLKGFWNRILGLFGKGTNGNYRIFRCPNCRQKIRVPRNKGAIEITCPKCRTTFRKRT